MIGQALTTAFALAAVLALIWAMGRLARHRVARSGPRRLMLEESVALDGRRHLHLIRCDQRHLLIQTGGTADLFLGWLDDGP